MNREIAIRDFFTRHHPETRFMAAPPNEAGFWFGHLPNSSELLPIIHIYTLFDRSCELDDEDFNRLLYGLSEVIRLFYEVTDRQASGWDPDVDIFGVIRARMMAEDPEVEAVLTKILHVD